MPARLLICVSCLFFSTVILAEKNPRSRAEKLSVKMNDVAPDSASEKKEIACDIQLHSFNTPNGIQLTWSSAGVYCATGYEIEKWDGKSFVILGLVQSNNQAEGQESRYIFEDAYPEKGANVYRVRVVCNQDVPVVSVPCATVLKGSENQIAPYLSAVNNAEGNISVYSSFHADRKATLFVFNSSGEVLVSRSVAFGKNGEAILKLDTSIEGQVKLAIADESLNQAVPVQSGIRATN